MRDGWSGLLVIKGWTLVFASFGEVVGGKVVQGFDTEGGFKKDVGADDEPWFKRARYLESTTSDAMADAMASSDCYFFCKQLRTIL